jgi:4-hydroxybenzoate polyprenyltransferase
MRNDNYMKLPFAWILIVALAQISLIAILLFAWHSGDTWLHGHNDLIDKTNTSLQHVKAKYGTSDETIKTVLFEQTIKDMVEINDDDHRGASSFLAGSHTALTGIACLSFISLASVFIGYWRGAKQPQK